jgi:hypothetical protein
VLSAIPPNRLSDVVLIDPSDEEYSIGFNVLAAESDLEKNLLAADLVSIFERLSTSWGDQMASVLNYAILAFLESTEGGTLADLQKFLLEPEFRNRFLATVSDDQITYYWRKGFSQLGSGKSIGPLLTRLGFFLSAKPIRFMVAQRDNRLHFGDLMNRGNIILVRLPQGQLGKENAFLLGSLIVSKIQQAAMARQRIPEARRRLHTLYVDEFQNFLTPSMAEILSGARKYRVGLVLAHQSLDQIKRHEEIGSAVLANAGTRVVFRVSEADARELERGFMHFDAKVLQSLPTGEAIARIERNDADFNISIPLPDMAELQSVAVSRDSVIKASREAFAKSRSEIEKELAGGKVADAKVKVPPVPEKEDEAKPQEPQSSQPPSPPLVPLALSPPPPIPDPLYTPPSIRPVIESLGRGGLDHQAAQIELKNVAEGLGFRAVIECQVPGSKQAADLFLERDSVRIACEISVTNTLDAEIANVRKHLRALVPTVAVICLEADKLRRIQEALTNSLSAEQLSRVRFFLKEEFVTYLQTLGTEPHEEGSKTAAPKRQKGWKVTVTTAEASPEETRLREEQIAASLAASFEKRRVRRKKK